MSKLLFEHRDYHLRSSTVHVVMHVHRQVVSVDVEALNKPHFSRLLLYAEGDISQKRYNYTFCIYAVPTFWRSGDGWNARAQKTAVVKAEKMRHAFVKLTVYYSAL